MRALAFLALVGCGATGSGMPDGGQSDALPSRLRLEDYIRGDRYPRLELEIDMVFGYEPRPAVMTDLVEGLATVLDKPGGIAAVLDGEIESKGADHAWTTTELHDLGHVPDYQPGGWDTITMHVLFVDGHSALDSENSKVLGLAFGGEHVVIFKKTIEDTCASAPLLVRERVCALAELGVWTHEVGHLLGLVDNGLPMVMPHKDATHGAHDVSDECIMHWAWEGQDLVTLLTSRVVAGNDEGLGFDAACLADIAAVRNR